MRTRGMVYVMTNAVDNEVVAFRRKHDGTLSLMNVYQTGGSGTDNGLDPLASQGALALSPDRCFLFAVNAGSNDISSFCVAPDGALTLADVVPSGGIKPNSLDSCGRVLYVSNVGSSSDDSASNITGFHIHRCGQLTKIPHSKHFLSDPDAQPARVLFTPGCNQVVVSELTTNRLTVFQVMPSGRVTRMTVNDSNGMGPFGSVFLSPGILLVAEAGTNALSSYRLCPNGILTVISGSVQTDQMATCWVANTPDERFAYTSNTGSGTISIYKTSRSGTLQLMEAIPSTPDGSGAPIDSGVSQDGLNFYVLNGNQGSVSVFRIECDGRLVELQVKDCKEVPESGTQGLAVY